MALFLRRQLQSYLDDLGAQLPADAIARLITNLNGGADRPLSAEWEVALLWAFSHPCRIEYETGDPNERKLDLIAYRRGNVTPLFSADIRCVSDEGHHEANPVDEFVDVLVEAWRASGARGGLDWRVSDRMDRETYGDQKVLLSLPRDEATRALLRDRVQAFLESCKGTDREASIDLSEIVPGLRITFEPEGRGFSGGHLSYTATYSRRRNPVANALRAKRKQVRAVAPESLRGIILCDGGCALLTERSGIGGACSLRDVVLEHIDDAPDIDFVLTFGIDSRYASPLLGIRESHTVWPQIFGRSKDHDRLKPVLDVARTAVAHLPMAEVSPANARRRYLHRPLQRRAHMKSMRRSDDAITVSSRWLVALLAGKSTVSEAFEEYGLDADSTKFRDGNPFLRMLKAGRLPTSITVHKDDAANDDHIEFKFGKPDPAVAPFQIRQS